MLQKEKLLQVISILNELNIDMWLTLGRETEMNNDPVLPLISCIDYTAITGIAVTKTGKTIALVGHSDAEGTKQTGLYDEVIGYDTSFEKEITKILARVHPSQTALNFSVDDVAADGLSHGMFLYFSKILQSYGYSGEIISSSEVIGRLRGRKTSEEKNRIIKAVKTTEKIFEEAKDFIKVGITEKEIFDLFKERMRHYDVTPSWEASQCPGIRVGPLTAVGHCSPSDIRVNKGDVISIDFGITEDEYCSDLQRVYYVLKEGETMSCSEVQRAFETLQEAVRRAAAFMKPGVTGSEVDAVARAYVVSQGYPQWNYALGHQVGRFAHDGGCILAPNWERYDFKQVNTPIEEGNVFTLEPGIPTSRGYVTQEDMVYVTKDGVEFLSTPQKEIFLI